MTEKQLREKIVSIAVGWLGCKESDGTHKKIIDVYNSHKPLARGYAVKYTDAWCSTYASAVAIKAGLTDIIPTECGCEKHTELFKKMGAWVEDDSYTPKAGDYIFYDWDDSGVGDTKGYADHVGIVVSVSGTSMKIIEGNMSNAVGYRDIKVNAKYIRGYGVPNYASKATEAEKEDPKPVTPSTTTTEKLEYMVGDLVQFTGCLHYTSSYKNGVAKGCKAGVAKVTAISKNQPHPYHLKAVAGKGSTVCGWVNAGDIASKATSTTAKTYKVVRGDNLSKIAKANGTTVDILIKLNGIKNKNLIYEGQIIKLP